MTPVTKALKAFSTEESQKLKQDKDLSDRRIQLVKFGKASKYLSFDAGKVEMANNFFNATKKTIKNADFKQKYAALQSVEDSFVAAREVGFLDLKSAQTMYKRRLVEWFTDNSGVNGINEGLFKAVAPKTYSFMRSSDLTGKQVQRIMDDNQVRSMKRIDKMKADGTWQKLDNDTKRKFLREAQIKERETIRDVKKVERSDKQKFKNLDSEGDITAWWESWFED